MIRCPVNKIWHANANSPQTKLAVNRCEQSDNVIWNWLRIVIWKNRANFLNIFTFTT